MAFLLDSTTEDILMNARIGDKSRVKVPNDSGVLSEPVLARLSAIAALLGVDFAQTEFTFTISQKEDRRNIYDVVIAVDAKGVPSVFWGKSIVPLKPDVLKRLTVETIASDKFDKSYLGIEYETEDEIETVLLPMSLKALKEEQVEGKKYPVKTFATKDQLKTALKKGTLDQYLNVRTADAEKMDNMEPGIYTVIAYKRNRFNKFEVTLEDGRVFVLKGSASRVLEGNPLVDVEHPAMLTVGESTPSVYAGRPCVMVNTALSVWADTVEPGDMIVDASGKQIPVFSL